MVLYREQKRAALYSNIRRDIYAAEKPQFQFSSFIFFPQQLFELQIIRQLQLAFLQQLFLFTAEPRAKLPFIHVSQFQTVLFFFIRTEAEDHTEVSAVLLIII